MHKENKRVLSEKEDKLLGAIFFDFNFANYFLN